MGCFSGIVKYLLWIFNVLIVLCGIALIAAGAVLLVKENKGISSFTEFSVGGFAIAIGVIIFLIAFFGCCGAIRENKCLLTTYAVILILLFIIQVVLGALAFVAVKKGDGNDEIHKKVETAVNELFDKYWKNSTEFQKDIDSVQEYFECCGVKGPQDYPVHLKDILPSCYKDKDKSSNANLFNKGCADAFEEIITSSIKIIGGVALGFAIVELVGAIFACIVRNRS